MPIQVREGLSVSKTRILTSIIDNKDTNPNPIRNLQPSLTPPSLMRRWMAMRSQARHLLYTRSLDIVPHMQTLLDFFSFQQAPLYFLRKQRFVYTLPISTSCCYKRICTPHFPTQVVLPHLSLSLFSPVPLASILLQICVVSVFSSVFPNSTCILSVNQ